MASSNGKKTPIELDFDLLVKAEGDITRELAEVEKQADALRLKRNGSVQAFLSKYGQKTTDRKGRTVYKLPEFEHPAGSGKKFLVLMAYQGKDLDAKAGYYIRRSDVAKPALASLAQGAEAE